MVLAYYPVAFAVLGALVYAFTGGKLSEAGRLLVASGLLALAFSLAAHTVRIG